MAKLKRGTVFKNEWAKNETYFIYNDDQNGFANGIRYTKNKSGWEMKHISDYRVDWLGGTRFTRVGFIDFEKILIEKLEDIISESNQEKQYN